MLLLMVTVKISPGQFRAIYDKLTGDKSVSSAEKSKEMYEQMKLISKTADPNILQNLHANNGRK